MQNALIQTATPAAIASSTQAAIVTASAAVAFTATTCRAVASAERGALKAYAAIIVHALRDGKSNVRGYPTELRKTLQLGQARLDAGAAWKDMTDEARIEAADAYFSRFKKYCEKAVGIAAKAGEFGLATSEVHEMDQGEAIKYVLAWLTGPVIGAKDVQTMCERFGFASGRKEAKTPEAALQAAPVNPDDSGSTDDQADAITPDAQDGIDAVIAAMIAQVDAVSGDDQIALAAALQAHCAAVLAAATLARMETATA